MNKHFLIHLLTEAYRSRLDAIIPLKGMKKEEREAIIAALPEHIQHLLYFQSN